MRVDEIEQEAVEALERWLYDHCPVADNGEPTVWADGRPVALDVLRVIEALRRHKTDG
jgi:hypothetical protein